MNVVPLDAHKDLTRLTRVQTVMRQLAVVWVDFESRLNQVPIVQKLNRGRLRLEDYRDLLVNLRQQVVDGGCWISRAASHIDEAHFELRSRFMSHAATEHRDYKMLEQDFVSVGGELDVIRNTPKNVGSEALSAWMFQRASQPNPFDLLGAMFIIEGLGQHKAEEWGTAIRNQLDLADGQVRFLLYHGANDDDHLKDFEDMVVMGADTDEIAGRIVKTAKVTARLYELQLAELGNV